MKFYVRDCLVTKSIFYYNFKFLVEFSTYLNYVRSLKFEDKPDYDFLRKIFKELFFRMGYEWDFMFDWAV